MELLQGIALIKQMEIFLFRLTMSITIIKQVLIKKLSKMFFKLIKNSKLTILRELLF